MNGRNTDQVGVKSSTIRKCHNSQRNIGAIRLSATPRQPKCQNLSIPRSQKSAIIHYFIRAPSDSSDVYINAPPRILPARTHAHICVNNRLHRAHVYAQRRVRAPAHTCEYSRKNSGSGARCFNEKRYPSLLRRAGYFRDSRMLKNSHVHAPRQ